MDEKKWEKLRQQIARQSAVWADLTKPFTSSSRKYILLQVNVQVILQVSQCSYKYSFV
jgi:hypothetical protein